jgi:hypothetical protein
MVPIFARSSSGTLPTNAPIAIPDDANIHFELFRAVSFTGAVQVDLIR